MVDRAAYLEKKILDDAVAGRSGRDIAVHCGPLSKAAKGSRLFDVRRDDSVRGYIDRLQLSGGRTSEDDKWVMYDALYNAQGDVDVSAFLDDLVAEATRKGAKVENVRATWQDLRRVMVVSCHPNLDRTKFTMPSGATGMAGLPPHYAHVLIALNPVFDTAAGKTDLVGHAALFTEAAAVFDVESSARSLDSTFARTDREPVRWTALSRAEATALREEGSIAVDTTHAAVMKKPTQTARIACAAPEEAPARDRDGFFELGKTTKKRVEPQPLHPAVPTRIVIPKDLRRVVAGGVKAAQMETLYPPSHPMRQPNPPSHGLKQARPAPAAAAAAVVPHTPPHAPRPVPAQPVSASAAAAAARKRMQALVAAQLGGDDDVGIRRQAEREIIQKYARDFGGRPHPAAIEAALPGQITTILNRNARFQQRPDLDIEWDADPNDPRRTPVKPQWESYEESEDADPEYEPSEPVTPPRPPSKVPNTNRTPPRSPSAAPSAAPKKPSNTFWRNFKEMVDLTTSD